MERIRVIYIMGHDRSGSTVMDVVLGNHPDLVSTGELINLTRDGWLGNELCACHQPVRECGFWSAVFEEWRANNSEISVHAYHDMQNKLIRFRCWPHLLMQLRRKSALFMKYEEATLALFRAICQVSGRNVIVDSSKSGRQAFALSLLDGVDLKVIHLVRDVRGVAWSQKKGIAQNEETQKEMSVRPIPVWMTSASWMIYNLESYLVCQRMNPKNTKLIHYENFAMNPEGVLRSIGTLTGVDFSEQVRGILSGEMLRPEHLVSGNRLRMKKTLQLGLDAEWEKKMTTRDRFICMLLCGWLQVYFQHSDE